MRATSGHLSWRIPALAILAAAVFVAVMLTSGRAHAFILLSPPVSVGDAQVTEGDSGSTVVNVPYSFTVNGLTQVTFSVTPQAPATSADIQASSSSRYYGTGSYSGTVAVTVYGDLDREPSQLAVVSVSAPAFFGGDTTGTVTVIDNDHPVVTVDDRASEEDGAPDGAGNHTIHLSKGINQTTDLRVRTVPGTATANVDFTPLDLVLHVPAHTVTTQVTVPIIADEVAELLTVETYTLVVNAVNAGDIGAGGRLVATGTISDNDGFNPLSAVIQAASDAIPPGNALQAACRENFPVGEAFVDPYNATFRIVLSQAAPRAFEFNLFTITNTGEGPPATDGSDFNGFDKVLVFPAGARSMTFSVTILDDSVTEGDEFFGFRADGPEISTAPVCEQNFTSVESTVKITANVW